MLPPKEGIETRSKCSTIGCESYTCVAYRKETGYSVCVLKCDTCGYEQTTDRLQLPLVGKIYGKCVLNRPEDPMVLCDEHHCKICGGETANFVFPEQKTQRECIKQYPCCNTFSCYLELVKRLEAGDI